MFHWRSDEIFRPEILSLYIILITTCQIVSASLRMFAENANVSFASPTLSELENVLNQELQNINLWLKVQ